MHHLITSSLSLTHTVLSPSQFSIGDTTGPEYLHGGIVRQVKVHKTLHFVSIHVHECTFVEYTCTVHVLAVSECFFLRIYTVRMMCV